MRVPGALDRLFVDTPAFRRAGDHLVQIWPELLAGRTHPALKSYGDSVRAGDEFSASAANRWRRQRLSLWGLSDEQLAEIEQQAPSVISPFTPHRRHCDRSRSLRGVCGRGHGHLPHRGFEHGVVSWMHMN
jgi:hypothetical protein